MLKSKRWPLPTIPWNKYLILPKVFLAAKGNTLISWVWFLPVCLGGIQTVSMDDCRQPWVVVDDHEVIYMILEHRLTALGYGMGKANNGIEGIVVIPVVTCGMLWDIDITVMNRLSLLSLLHINFL